MSSISVVSKQQGKLLEWCDIIELSAMLDGTEVGSCEAKFIRAARVRPNFHELMDEPSRDTSRLAIALFDDCGLLRSIYQHGARKGSGVWQDELDEGNILVVEYIRVDTEHRRKGVASKLMGDMINRCRKKCKGFFAFAEPSALTEEIDRLHQSTGDIEIDSQHKADLDRQERTRSFVFFRSIGFRRVGTSSWMAFANDPQHPSHQLSAADDANVEEVEGTQEMEVERFAQFLRSMGLNANELHF
jgi:GNAT superfamily N-acetyltransferase